jgi:hypothetical protein
LGLPQGPCTPSRRGSVGFGVWCWVFEDQPSHITPLAKRGLVFGFWGLGLPRGPCTPSRRGSVVFGVWCLVFGVWCWVFEDQLSHITPLATRGLIFGVRGLGLPRGPCRPSRRAGACIRPLPASRLRTAPTGSQVQNSWLMVEGSGFRVSG